jgi:hypothetical protein
VRGRIGEGPVRLSALIVATATGVAGCSGSDVYYAPTGTPAPTVIRTVTIQTDTIVTPIDIGKAAGLFVDYRAGGEWRIQATCNVLEPYPCEYDTTQDCIPPPCAWDLVAMARSGPLDFVAAALDPEDRIYRANDGAIRLYFDTTTEIDSVRLLADPGEGLQLDVLLDYYNDVGKVTWTQEAATEVTTGAPSNPVVFTPTSP